MNYKEITTIKENVNKPKGVNIRPIGIITDEFLSLLVKRENNLIPEKRENKRSVKNEYWNMESV